MMKEFRPTNAFLIQFRGSPEAWAGTIQGRIEHVASGNTATFASIEELPQLLIAMLRSLASDDGNEGRSN